MDKVLITVEKTKTGYSGYARLSGGIVATTANTLEELKTNAKDACNCMFAETGEPEITEKEIVLDQA